MMQSYTLVMKNGPAESVMDCNCGIVGVASCSCARMLLVRWWLANPTTSAAVFVPLHFDPVVYLAYLAVASYHMAYR